MFPNALFPPRYFAPRYWPRGIASAPEVHGKICGKLYILPMTANVAARPALKRRSSWTVVPAINGEVSTEGC